VITTIAVLVSPILKPDIRLNVYILRYMNILYIWLSVIFIYCFINLRLKNKIYCLTISLSAICIIIFNTFCYITKYEEDNQIVILINKLRNNNVNLQNGIGTYWDARYIQLLLNDNTRIFSVHNDLTVYPWCLWLRAYPNNNLYNFIIRNKNKEDSYYQINTDNLPIGYTYYCNENKNIEIYHYPDDTLNRYFIQMYNFMLFEIGKPKNKIIFTIPSRFLYSKTGVIQNNKYIANEYNQPGWLLYGPYIRLSPGVWKASIHYSSTESPGYYELSSLDKKIEESKYNFYPGDNIGCIIFTVDDDTNPRYEVRCYYNGIGSISISSVIFEKI
jgi:hypothetical protein